MTTDQTIESEIQPPMTAPHVSTESTAMNLKFDLIGAAIAGEKRHAQVVMRELGIKYQLATPQSMFDSWWFWNCKNVPTVLPSYLTELRVNPKEVVGYGLSEVQASAVSEYAERARYQEGGAA